MPARRRGPRRKGAQGITLNTFLICSSSDTIRQKLGAAMSAFDDSPQLVRACCELQKQRNQIGQPADAELIEDARKALAAGAVYGGEE